jgi:ankyrin repeat protein
MSFNTNAPAVKQQTTELIEKGADVNAIDNLENSAMHYATEGGYTEIVGRLIIAGAVH